MRNCRPVRPAAPLTAAAAALFVTALAALFALPATAASPTLRVSAAPATVAAGGSVEVEYTVKPLPATLVLRLDHGSQKTVRARKARGQTTFNLPAGSAAGPHKLTVCVKATCRALTLKVSRRALAASQGSPPSPSPAQTQQLPPAPRPEAPASAIDFTGPANPLDVEAHTDPSRRATATIDTWGGTLETTGADGTHYKLTVPEGALLSPEQISMTPIAAVDDLPFAGGLAAGVQLEPSGLRFSDYVTVEISDHPPVAPAQETGFLYQRDGVEFQLYPVQESASKTTFKIIHFSGVGIASGTEAERNAQLLRATRDVEGRFGQQLATYIRPGEEINYTAVKATLRAYHDQILKPLVTAATSDDGLAIQAIHRYLSWSRMVQLLFADEDFMLAERAALEDQWLAIIKNAAKKAYRRCIDENRPQELTMILAWSRMLALMGLNAEIPADGIWRCARFELDFHTKITQKRPGNFEGPEIWKGEAIAENLIIEPDSISLEQRGTKEAEYVDFRVDIPPHKSGTGCWRGGGEWESVFPLTVSRLMIDLNPVLHPDGTYGYPEINRGKIALSIVPFFVKEFQFWVDCGGSTGSGGWGAWLAPTFLELHEDQLDDFGGMVFTDWTVPDGGGSMLGAKTYFRTVMLGGEETREETTLELYHAPVVG
ncbi:MAG TPA: hypothetical protein VFJ57_00740 [Solirubrobacterales bacterium]|nr:hypothetical protein [Solirubrobacterales bacterium]